MATTTTTYWIEVNEDGVPKKVPHTGKKHCEFIDKAKAVDFLENLRANNKPTKFRLAKCTKVYGFGEFA
jgi:hypothetical protein